MSELLKGAPVAAAITQETAARAEALKNAGIVPTLAILRVGENDSDLSYERGATNRCEKAGVAVRRIALPETVTEEEMEARIEAINADDSIHGLLMFRPLPRHLNEKKLCEMLLPQKDVDGMTSGSAAAVFSQSGSGFAPCTAQACMEILSHYGVPTDGARVAVIGRSLVIGRPVAMMLLAANATVTICHTHTKDLESICREADIIVAAAGVQEMVGASYMGSGQTVIDVGIHVREDGTLCGDVDFASVEETCAAITPVPGGVGAVTTAVLAKHVVEAAARTGGIV